MSTEGVSHPEELCQDCKRPNAVWFAPNHVWNMVVGSPSGILCPVCFIKRADRLNLYQGGGWKLAPEDSRGKQGMCTVTRAECEAIKSCADCSDGILLRDSLYYDLDREDEEQLCPAFVHRLARDHIALLDSRDELAKALEQIKDVDEGYDSYDAAWKIADDALKGMLVESELAKAADALATALERVRPWVIFYIDNGQAVGPIQDLDAALAQWKTLKGEI